MKLAMIGLGKMGGNMATRLLRNGVKVVGYDRTPSVVDNLVAKEAEIIKAKLGKNFFRRPMSQ